MTVVNLAVSSFSTTGTITVGVGLNKLVVPDASGFAVNDYIIIGVGGELGAGARGTVGVGGTWPYKSYPNKAAMDLDTTQPEGKYAYCVDTGDVYRWFNAVGYYWTPQTGSGVGYYVQKVIPRALATKITGKSGTTLTLETAATVATTNATVYFDNAAIIQAVIGYGSGVPDNSEIILPTGQFAVSIQMGLYGHHNWVVHGTSKELSTLFFPEGTSGSCMFGGDGNNNLVFRDFGMLGNCRSQGYMMHFQAPNETQAYYMEGIKFTNCPGMIIQDVKGVDCFKTFSFEAGCHGAIARRVEAILTEGCWIEVWQFSGNDCDNLRFIDCSMTAATWSPGPEMFRTNYCSMVGLTLVNSFLAMNSDNYWLLEDINSTVNGAEQGAPLSIFGTVSPIIDINSTIDEVTGGGQMKNITVTQNGTVPPNNDTVRGIAINVKNVNVSVIGAAITLPDYVPGSTMHGATGLISDAVNTSVAHFTCHGTTRAGWANLMLGGANGTHRCADVDSVVGGTELPCRTFAIHCA